MSSYGDFLQASLSKYEHPDKAKQDVLSVFTAFSDLRPKLDSYEFKDGSRKARVKLEGTIPVTFRGVVYNTPICVWLKEAHPYVPPKVYVRPTSSMVIKPSQIVDANGKVRLPYVREWKYPDSDLVGLLQILVIEFSEVPPLFSKQALKSEHEQFLVSSLKKYDHPDKAKQDVMAAFTAFSQLRPKLELYVFNDGSRKTLLQLEGAIPVTHKGAVYNIPICIWLMESHPYVPPKVYVKPTSTMAINPGRCVDTSGRINLPYLRKWRYPNSDLLSLLHSLMIEFGEVPPVYSTRPVKQSYLYSQ